MNAARPAGPAGERALAWGLVAPCLLAVAVFAFYPIAHTVYLSLHRLVMGLPGLGRPWAGLDNFALLFTDPLALKSLANTVLFVVVSTGLELVLGMAMALVINASFRGRAWVRAAVLVPWAIPTVVASQMWRFVANDNYGALNLVLYGSEVAAYQAWLAEPGWALALVIAADVWKTSSFAALIILAGLQTIAPEMMDAAELDGAGPWRRLWYMTLPAVRPALAVALIFRTMDAFRVFDLVYVMTRGGPGGATSVLQFFGYQKMFAEGFMGYGASAAVLVFALAMVFSLGYLALFRKVLFPGREG